jgi:uncharacterized protein (DUF433 family)
MKPGAVWHVLLGSAVASDVDARWWCGLSTPAWYWLRSVVMLLDERGVAWLDDTNVKVVEVVLEHLAHGASPEEIRDQHRGYMTLAQIHAALSYYYDNQPALDDLRAAGKLR